MPKLPLLLIPGLLSTGVVWQGLQLEGTTISFHGENTPETMVQTILRGAPQQFVLMGHSMGGWLALEVVRRVPERVLKLCLLNTSARPDSREKRERRHALIARASQGQFATVAKELAEMMVFQKGVQKAVEEMFLQTGAQRLIDDETSMLQRQEVMSLLPKVNVPTLIVHARQDRVFSLEEHEEMALKIQGSRLAVVEESGHMLPMEQPQALATLIRAFLQRI